MTAKPVDLALRFVDGINRQDLQVLTELMTDDHVTVDENGSRRTGRQAAREWWTLYFASYPDYQIRPSQAISVADTLLLFGRSSYSHLSPTIWAVQVRDGLVAQWHAYQDCDEARKALNMRRGQSVWLDVPATAAELDADLRALEIDNAPNRDRLRRGYHQRLKTAPAEQVIDLAHLLLERHRQRGTAYQVIHNHPAAMRSLDAQELQRLGQGIDSWGAVDSFGLYVAGPAWREGQVSEAVIQRWARSEDRWWRRAALVCTVALNVKARGGHGDPPRTLAVCRLLVDDHDDMVVKALSWALRDLIQHDRQGVEAFLVEFEDRLAARVKREVRNKLRTGLKNP
jgi:3-methyladenine DNA glycosylase AlkD